MNLSFALILQCFTLKDMCILASMHSVKLGVLRTRQQISARMVEHEASCVCGEFATVLLPSSLRSCQRQYLRQYETSVDIALHVIAAGNMNASLTIQFFRVP